ncbi:MAG: phosphoglucosamine mutase [Bacteroidales bacterium]|nr:phosphoglucosamine mutase [Bacteroidales bacterium]
MTLIKSISGIRGTIGGSEGLGLTPPDIVKFCSAYYQFLKTENLQKQMTIVIGRDARISGEMVNRIVSGSLISMGANVIDLGLSTTPTVEMAVKDLKADGGIIITASHNPKNWNALKLLNAEGEFLSEADGKTLLDIAEKGDFNFAEVENLGSYTTNEKAIERHIEQILNLKLVDIEAIKKANFKVAIDCVNSTGSLALPMLLTALNVIRIEKLYCDPDGKFPHNPEPLPENLNELSKVIVSSKADVGFAVDPDVDRLAIICENGDMFGEEYTLVSVSDYILSNNKGNTVSNLSSTRALKDITEKAGAKYYASAVGEVNVVKLMKEKKAVIGGEGNGGIIYPELHYGRDALVGIALFLSHLAKSGKKCSELRTTYPQYFISKNKIELPAEANVDDIINKLKNKYSKQPANYIDGLKIEFDKEWVHLRKSNTEPIIRIYSESDSMQKAYHLANKLIDDIKEIMINND